MTLRLEEKLLVTCVFRGWTETIGSLGRDSVGEDDAKFLGQVVVKVDPIRRGSYSRTNLKEIRVDA